MLPYPLNQKTHARKLRRDITDAEKKLWAGLRDRQLCGAKFRRQHPMGPFITDFCCVARGLMVDLDVGQHAERSAANDVLTNLTGVLERISEELKSPHPCPLPKGEG